MEDQHQARMELRELAAQELPGHECRLRREILNARAELDRWACLKDSVQIRGVTEGDGNRDARHAAANQIQAGTCGAKTQAGTPCKQKTIYANGRCKWHGGLSSGPKTDAGKEQARVNGRKGGRPRKPKS